MKTFVLGLALLVVTLAASAQTSRTAYESLTVVPTTGGMAAQLTWKKGDEKVAYFIVERSTDGIDFKQCAVVFTSEEPDFVNYKFKEKIANLSQGLVYRLAIVNEQRRITYLPAKTLVDPASL